MSDILITGKRLYLRPIQEGDLPFLERWINDPEVSRFVKSSYQRTWFDRLRKETNVVFGIVLTDENQFIGHMGVYRINYRNGTGVTDSFIGAKEHWNKGYGTEAKMLLLEYAFNTLNLRKICSSVFDYNLRSRKYLEKCGYQVEGILKEHVFRSGRYVDMYQLAVFREQWLPLWIEYKQRFLDTKVL